MCEKYLEYETKLIHLQLMRITPAGAGKTKPTDGHILRKQDHPRRCGENYTAIHCGPSLAGITPAGAGKTNRLYYTFIRQKKQHMTFSVILSVHHKY